MSDRRAVSAGHLAGASVAASSEPWRVAVGGNRVQSMTVEQIAYAFSAGQLSVRTPLWPPGTSGWQALGNFEQFQSGAPAPEGNYGQLAQFEEADDDPTRMWTGSNDLSELPGMDVPDMMPMPPEPSVAPPSRPSARTGPRQVSRPPRSLPAPAPPAPRISSAMPMSRSTRPRRGSGVWLVAGLVGLVGLGSAVLAARGNWSAAAPAADVPANEQAAAAPAAPAQPEAPSVAAAPSEAEAALNQARPAKYEEAQPSAFVAEAETPRPAEATPPSEAPAEAAPAATPEAAAPAPTRATTTSSKLSTRTRERAKVSSTTAKRSPPPVVASAPAKPKAAPPAEPAEPKEKEPVKEAKAEAAPAANAAVNAAAATALGNAAKLASSCRPRGGPSGDGKARVIYSPDGEVQSVEILTAKFRDTLTGSCVRMVFRRAKIPAFKGEPPTFIKSFTIPEE